VASIRFHFLGEQPYPRQRGATEMPCDVAVRRGQELGWFEHGSTLVLFVPAGYEPLVACGQRLRMGEALMRRPGRVIAAS
jgi:phosphatidylserine decarboxylase